MSDVTWVLGLLRRRPARLLGASAGIALAVAVTLSLGAFFATSKAQMTERAAKGVAVDWQVQVAPGADPAAVQSTVAATRGVTNALPVGFANTSGFHSRTGQTVQTTGPGKVLGLPDGYTAAFPGEIRFLVGARNGVLLAQQTAANLHAHIGSLIDVARPGLPPAQLHVQGIIDLPAADSLFQVIGAAPGTAPTAPPDNVALVPAATWSRLFGPAQLSLPGASYTQIHANLASTLPKDPAAAFNDVTGRANNLEAQLAGAGQIGDNLSAQLDGTRADAIYAQLLFLFLGLPAVILAAILTIVIGASGGSRRKRELALLRIRGASPSMISRLALAEAVTAGGLGVAVGIAAAAVAGHLAFGSASLGATPAQTATWFAAAIAGGLGLAFIAIALPARRDSRALSVHAAQAEIGSAAKPLWARLGLDFVLLAAAGLVYWQVVKSGYKVVLAPEGVPTISVSYVSFLAPLLLWAGAALLAWRIANTLLARGRKMLSRASEPMAHELSAVVAASMSRQRRLLSRGLLIVALTASFAISTAVFNSTFTAQALVDAQLTNGADVTVTTTAAAGLNPETVAGIVSLPGVAAAQSMQHRFAYVGNDLQDLYGVNPATISRATPMSNAFFGNGNAQQTLATLAARPDAVLVSDETIHDFQLQPGDLLRLRLQTAADNAYHVIPFHYVGVAREFPTAPHDSFLVANAAYVAKATGSPAVQTLLVRTSQSPPVVAARIRTALGPASGATVQDVKTALRVTLSSLPAIDLSGLTRLELGFAFLFAAGASGLILALGLSERRRMFAIASALGAGTRQLAAFVWSEALFVTVGGAMLGIVSGWLLASMIVKILTGVFDPPPQHLFVPWTYLAGLAVVTAAAIAGVGLGAIRATRQPAIEIVRDL